MTWHDVACMRGSLEIGLNFGDRANYRSSENEDFRLFHWPSVYQLLQNYALQFTVLQKLRCVPLFLLHPCMKREANQISATPSLTSSERFALVP
jgi:hypothetical protein